MINARIIIACSSSISLGEGRKIKHSISNYLHSTKYGLIFDDIDDWNACVHDPKFDKFFVTRVEQWDGLVGEGDQLTWRRAQPQS